MYPLRGVKLDVDTDSSELALPPDVRVTFVGFNDSEGPFPTVGETVAARFTAPEKPLTLRRVRLDVAEEPCERVIEVESTVTVKSPSSDSTRHTTGPIRPRIIMIALIRGSKQTIDDRL